MDWDSYCLTVSIIFAKNCLIACNDFISEGSKVSRVLLIDLEISEEERTGLHLFPLLLFHLLMTVPWRYFHISPCKRVVLCYCYILCKTCFTFQFASMHFLLLDVCAYRRMGCCICWRLRPIKVVYLQFVKVIFYVYSVWSLGYIRQKG